MPQSTEDKRAELRQSQLVDDRAGGLVGPHRVVVRSGEHEGERGDARDPSPPARDVVLSQVVVEGRDAELDDVAVGERGWEPPAALGRLPHQRPPAIGLVGVAPKGGDPTPGTSAPRPGLLVEFRYLEQAATRVEPV